MTARERTRLRGAHRTLARLGAVPTTWRLPDGTEVRGDGFDVATMAATGRKRKVFKALAGGRELQGRDVGALMAAVRTAVQR